LGGEELTSIHILGNGRLPPAAYEAYYLDLRVVLVNGHGAEHDEQVYAVAVPETLDGQGKQAQDTPSSLEAILDTPVFVERSKSSGWRARRRRR